MAGIVPQAGADLLAETAKVVGLPTAPNTGSAPWRKPFAIHDQAKIVLDQDLSLPIGGNALADVDRLLAQHGPHRSPHPVPGNRRNRLRGEHRHYRETVDREPGRHTDRLA